MNLKEEITNKVKILKKGSHHLENKNWWVKCNLQLLYKNIEVIEGNSVREKIYLILNNLTSNPKCFCNKDTKFVSLSKGFNKFCSKSCQVKQQQKERTKESLIKGGVNAAKTRKSQPEKYEASYQNQEKYWLKLGYTENEAKEKVKERQTTFSLNKCIEKYGAREGKLVFSKRQKKWQNNLNSKSQEEIDNINKRKNSFLNLSKEDHDLACAKRSHSRMIAKFSSSEQTRNLPARIYYIRFYNDEIEFWKIGITINTIYERFGSENFLKREVLFEKEDTYYNCWLTEQKILAEFKDKRVSIKEDYFRSTECFNENILKERNEI